MWEKKQKTIERIIYRLLKKKNNIPNKLVNKWIIEENVSNAINVKNKILIHKKKNALQIIKKKESENYMLDKSMYEICDK